MKPLGFNLEEMRDLLSNLGRPDAPTTGTNESDEIARRRGGYSATAEERCQNLLKQLRSAQSLARQLRDRLTAHRRNT